MKLSIQYSLKTINHEINFPTNYVNWKMSDANENEAIKKTQTE